MVIIFFVCLSIPCIILFGVFIITFFNFSNEHGQADPNSHIFQEANDASRAVLSQPSASNPASSLQAAAPRTNTQFDFLAQESAHILHVACQIQALKIITPQNAETINDAFFGGVPAHDIFNMIVAVDLHIKDTAAYAKEEKRCESSPAALSYAQETKNSSTGKATSIFPWMNDAKWPILKKALTHDVPFMVKAGQVADVDPRMVASVVFVEQARVYWTAREFFKSVLRPFGLLSTGSNISLGTVNIKPNTAKMIEKNLYDSSSPLYPGKKYEHLLDFSTTNHDKERTKRLTSYTDTYYSYLYTAVYLKEYEAQWARAGYSISNRPEILATLFNIGFAHSHPNATPFAGGSTLTIGDTKYTFGGLAYEFYYSGVMNKELPLQ